VTGRKLSWKSSAVALGASAVSLALVIWFVSNDSGRVSPGPLSAAHGPDSGVDASDCESCHGKGKDERAEMARACGKCHADVGVEIAAGKGLHGHLPGDPTRCVTCHSEHHGPQFLMVSLASFLRAGVDNVVDFDHAGFDYRLGGKHLALACRKCHENSDAAVLPKGERRFMGKSQECASCHKDPHGGRLQECKSCHGEERPFPEAPLFAHTRLFSLTGVHAGASCIRCHERTSSFSIEADTEAGRRGELNVRNCAACHASPHAETFVAAAARELKVASERSCENCHALKAGAFAREGVTFKKEWHAFSGFALVLPHENQKCGACHAAGLAYKDAHAGRTPENCGACHADPHKGQFGERSCRECHAADAWKPSTYGVPEHARSKFPLELAHARAKCGACHFESDGVPRYAGTKKECVACHADAHPNSFRESTGCQECHQPDSFAASEKTFDHRKWTGFALDNAHAQSGCAACHARMAEAEPDTRRAFGKIEVHAPATAAQCVNCHSDAHHGSFKSAKDCDECHGTASFSKARESFDHAARAGFALVGSHQAMECTTCHAPSVARVDAALARSDCTSCHADIHGQSFQQTAKGCLECHTQVAWLEGRESFDHPRWTGFPLEGRHKVAGCESCHSPLPAGDPSGRRFARARGSQCSDCHADPHGGPFVAGSATACARCHVTSADFHLTLFDHQRDSRFPLDATHQRVGCAECHRDWRSQAGGTSFRFQPLGIECGDCHDSRR